MQGASGLLRLSAMGIGVKRVQDPAADADGLRVLVDRVWPRGVSKQAARVDRWLKDIAPGNQLRRWFGHDPDKWQAFKEAYFAELEERPEEVAELHDLARKQKVTLVFAAKDREHNNAVALKEYLEKKPKRPAS